MGDKKQEIEMQIGGAKILVPETLLIEHSTRLGLGLGVHIPVLDYKEAVEGLLTALHDCGCWPSSPALETRRE